ncbi:hypothetical protein [Profundibacter sp.]
MKRPLKNITSEVLEPVWMRHDIPTEVIAARLGVTRQAISSKAHRLGLPSRAKNRRKLVDDETFARMWFAGVSASEMADAFGYCGKAAITTRRRLLGLPARRRERGSGNRGGWPKTITITQFYEQELAERMKREAGMVRVRK